MIDEEVYGYEGSRGMWRDYGTKNYKFVRFPDDSETYWSRASSITLPSFGNEPTG